MIKYWLGTALTILVGLSACKMTDPAPEDKKSRKFADLPAYFKSENSQLISGNYTLNKSITLNNEADKVSSAADSTTVHDLLKPFQDIDLNKPSLKEEYDTSSIYDSFSGKTTVIYQSKGKQTSPSEITMELDKTGNIQQINIHSYTSNLVYEYRQDLQYIRQKQVRMATYQKIAFLQPKVLEAVVSIAPKNGN
ncbi:hypothetical protein J2T02_000148 [Chitinophaga terrae (ex Kim and Jung 2007)]|uniref:hypothetical protein n=1 Tax=Chitinophaga terrae (ex Kim and Jung 2007) TaxID=408074 RepID=UPI00278091ED|nr:hypothetical protein [Chitinophaga terrae (ex Kim and Jung 2007)]MDQ0105065.1 hypothetical protein [Chitinophaga terrae (ex Kim and Jung 2007)]